MSSPTNLSDLPVASGISSNDLMLVRRGLTDYQVAVALVQSINFGSEVLDPIPSGYALPNDLMLISRNNQNYNIRFSQVGLVKNTQMWFYTNTAPVGWSIVPNTGDQLLAVQGGDTYTTAGSSQGTWLQANATLTIDQIPAHQHTLPAKSSSGLPSSNVVQGNNVGAPINKIGTTTTGGNGSNQTASNPVNPDYSFPATNPHNHGDSWRPLANVGIICNKDG